MGIAIQIVKEDLDTVISYNSSIDIDDDYYYFRKVAREMNLVLLYTIDEAGVTIINQEQLYVFEDEIQKMRVRTDVNQKILDILDAVVKKVKPYTCEYIKFIGD